MKQMLRLDGYISIQNLAKQLAKKEVGLVTTTYHVFVKCMGHDKSIELYKSEILSTAAIPKDDWSSLIRVQIRGKFHESMILDYIRWLTTDRPRNITGLSIENDLENFNYIPNGEPQYSSNTPYDLLSNSSEEVRQQLFLIAKELHDILVATTASTHKSNSIEFFFGKSHR